MIIFRVISIFVLALVGSGESATTSPLDGGSGTDAGPVPVNTCLSGPDQAIFDSEVEPDSDALTRDCVAPLMLAGIGPGSPGFVDRVAECLSDKTGLSVECSACYALNAECSFDRCGVICLSDSQSTECRDCRCGRTGGENCMAQLGTCTGILTDYCAG